MSEPPPLPPQACGNEWCRREGRCFNAHTGGNICRQRPPLAQRQSEASVLQTIGHRESPLGRLGWGERRAPREVQVWCPPAVYEPVSRKVQPFLIVEHGEDYRVSDMLVVRESGTDRRCWRIVSSVTKGHDGLVQGYVVLGLGAR